MGSYGIRVSAPTKDVKTCNDLDCVVISKYSNLKASNITTGTKEVAEGTTQTVTIAHGLGYIPSVRLLNDMAGELDAGTYYDSPMFFSDGFGFLISANSRADTINVYLDFTYSSYGMGGSVTFSYKCFIFLDKGNLN